ncbi:MAG: ferredoxin [Oscillospiraceae bacterium]|nr:ferredoxin [Oscillospiraceae bacterium]
MHALVHEKTCIRCGLCPSICPEVFSLEEGESAHAITDPVPDALRLDAQAAADSCPVSAIEIR